MTDMQLPFSDLIRATREQIGLIQYKAAHHMGLTAHRLHNLEQGHFRDMPRPKEFEALSNLYRLSIDDLVRLATEQTAAMKRVSPYTKALTEAVRG